LNISFIAKVHKFGVGNINQLNRSEIENLTAKFDTYQNTYQDSYVLNYLQFRKGHEKTDEQIEVIEESQLSSDSPAFLFYEQDNETDEGVLLESLLRIQTLTEKEIWLVLEVETKRIAEKIDTALSLGIKNFIVRAGKYNSDYLWSVNIIGNIQQNKGTIIVALPRRHYRRDSYTKDFFQFGVDGVFHEVPQGWGGDILQLNSDYKYVDMLFEEAVNGYSEELRNICRSNHYGFSRVRALNVANSFSGTIEILQIVEET